MKRDGRILDWGAPAMCMEFPADKPMWVEALQPLYLTRDARLTPRRTPRFAGLSALRRFCARGELAMVYFRGTFRLGRQVVEVGMYEWPIAITQPKRDRSKGVITCRPWRLAPPSLACWNRMLRVIESNAA